MKFINRLVLTLLVGSLSIDALNVDYSNLDLKNFKFFRYPETNGELQPEPNIIENGANHINAVYTYFRNLVLGDPWLNAEQNQIFDPDTGKRNARLFYKQFGYRGRNLIDLLGRGYTREQLVNYGAIDNNFGR